MDGLQKQSRRRGDGHPQVTFSEPFPLEARHGDQQEYPLNVSVKMQDNFQPVIKKSLARELRGGLTRVRESGHSLVVKRYPSKLDMRVRFPLPAPKLL